jgi:rubredoxin
VTYIDHPIKCIPCGLHYTVHSWNEDWHQTDGGKERSATNGGVCPECGAIGGKIIFQAIPREGQIFEVVGSTPMTEMTQRVSPGLGHGAAMLQATEKEEGA